MRITSSCMKFARKRFTDGQMKLQKIIEDLGFETILERKFGDYSVDIFLPSENKAIEYDGVGHYKKRDRKRDQILLGSYGIIVLRIRDLKDEEILNKITTFITGD